MSVRNPEFYASWKEDGHATHFDGLRFVPTPLLVRRWEGFNEVRMLAGLLRREPTPTVLEVGCATGEMFRYMAKRHPRASTSTPRSTSTRRCAGTSGSATM